MDDLSSFRLYLLKQGKARGTIDTKITLLSRLLRDASPLSQKSVSDFLFDLHNKGRSAQYINTFLDALRLYCRYKGWDYFDVSYYKEKETFKTILSNEEIKSILECSPPRGGAKTKIAWDRWTLFFSICAYGGFRPGEVAKLEQRDLDFLNNTITVRESKTGDFRIVPISPKIKESLYNYTKRLNTELLFPSLRGGGYGVVDDTDWGYNFNVRLKKLGLDKKGITVYSLRFSFITRMLSDDVNLFKVQRIVGHRRVDQTAHYTRYVIKDLSKAIEKDSLAKDGLSPKIIARYILEAVEAIVGNDQRFKKKIVDEPNHLSLDIYY